MTAIQESVATSRLRARVFDGTQRGELTPVSAIRGPVHPPGGRARVLLCSVFGPYAQDDEYGSRRQNPMELWHNQVTREQGPFSLRMFHRTFGLLLLQANVDAPCTAHDFPSLDRFTEELRRERYDVIGIGAIVPNVGKVAKMCELIREHQPKRSRRVAPALCAQAATCASQVAPPDTPPASVAASRSQASLPSSPTTRLRRRKLSASKRCVSAGRERQGAADESGSRRPSRGRAGAE